MTEDPIFHTDQISPTESEFKIIDLIAEPYQDLQRIKVTFRLPYFQGPLNAAITLKGIEGEEVASVDVVNLFQPENEVTLHFPMPHPPNGDYQVELVINRTEEHEPQSSDTGNIQLRTQILTSSQVTFSIP